MGSIDLVINLFFFVQGDEIPKPGAFCQPAQGWGTAGAGHGGVKSPCFPPRPTRSTGSPTPLTVDDPLAPLSPFQSHSLW